MNDIAKREYTREVIPTFQVNWDPFHVLAEWQELCQRPDFGNAVQSLARCYANAIHIGLLPKTPIELGFSAEDITLQAFFISFSEIFYESKRIIDSMGWITESDLINFPDLIGQRNSQNENFIETMITIFYWFQNLVNTYEKQGYQPRDKFEEFCRLGPSKHDILRNIDRQRKAFGSFSIQFYQADDYGTMDFFFDFENGETIVCMKDFVMGSEYRNSWFSEFLDTEKPFLQNKKLNFLYPMGYRRFTFPLINVTEIKLQLRDGSGRIYKYGSEMVSKIGKDITDHVDDIMT